jgi:uncharacterized membrane protein YcaP (DUF421 family)
VLFGLTRLIGSRQVSQLSMFDYINGITIGSIAAELAAARGQDFWNWLVALVVYGVSTTLISIAANKSLQFRSFMTGKPLILFQNGQFNRENFQKSRLDLGEFLTQCRINGWFDLDSLDTVLIEPNGSFSFLPKEAQRPATPQDFQQSPQQTTLPLSILQDGQVMEGNLQAAGWDVRRLDRELTGRQLGRDDVFLACIGQNGALQIFTKSQQSKKSSQG